MKRFFPIAFLAILALSCADKKDERQYQSRWCEENGGRAEVVLSDRTRCDCVTDSHAVEIEKASNWKEAIGQALHYASKTGKAPGIVLICRDGKDRKYLNSLDKVLDENDLKIRVWTMGNH